MSNPNIKEEWSTLKYMQNLCSSAKSTSEEHLKSASCNTMRSNIFSVTTISLTIFTSSALFLTIFSSIPNLYKIIGAILGFLATIFSVIQILFRFKEKASKHSELANCFKLLANTCFMSTYLFKDDQLNEDEFRIILRTNVELLNQIIARSVTLDPNMKCNQEILTPAE